jgi:hypothetical protein
MIKNPRGCLLIFCAILALAPSACENSTAAEDAKNNDAAILSFRIGEAIGAISGSAIDIWLEPDTDKTSLTPEITVSRGAAVEPVSGAPQNFSAPVSYTVTAEDGGIEEYSVTVRSESSLNPPDFTSVEAMTEYLFAFEGKNNKDTPINVVLSLDLGTLEGISHANNTSNDWLGAIFDNLNGKYITLDLSACSGDFIGGTGTAAEIQATIQARRDTDKLVELILPASEISLPDYIFSYIHGLRRARLAPEKETLATGIFLGCDFLEEVDFNGAPLTVSERAFSGCTSLESITNSSGLREIQGYAFESCSALSGESLNALLNPGEPLTLGAYAFAGCTALTSLTGTNIGAMGQYVFANCINLVSVTVPASVTSIGVGAFSGTGLTSIEIPASVTSIGSNAFNGCASLDTITVLRPSSDGITALSGSLGSTPALTAIHVPDAVYVGASGWNGYFGMIVPAGDSDGVVNLVDGIWQDGEITSAGEIQFYRFPITAGRLYGVWANHNGYVGGSAGDGSKTLFIYVTATYEGSVSAIFELDDFPATGTMRRYVCPQTFVAESDGSIILRVKAGTSGNTGTYAVKYGEIKPLAAGVVETGTLVAGGAQWYCFVPNPSTQYTVSWEDSAEQATESSYTGNVVVTAFRTARIGAVATSPVIEFGPVDSGYTMPQTLTSSTLTNADRIQLIRVEAETGGSYSIKYQ